MTPPQRRTSGQLSESSGNEKTAELEPFDDGRDYDDDDRHCAYDASFPEPEGADRW